MRSVTAMMMCIYFSGSVCGQGNSERYARIALALAVSPEQVVETKPATPPPLTYSEAAKTAFKENKPLVVFLGAPSHPVLGCVVVSVDTLEGFAGPAVITSTTGDKWMVYRDTLSATVDNDAILQSVGRKEVKPSATPFVSPSRSSWPPPSAGEAVDADLQAAGPWPTSLDNELLKGMRRYKRASMTQAISINTGVDGVRRHVIEPTHRLGIKTKWHQSGGLEGLSGWRSDLYRNDTAASARVYTGQIQVLNSLGTYQPNHGYRRQYPDGSRFMDVLSKDGEVFEVRQLEKKAGKWNPLVVYRNKDVRPSGYEGLTVACMTCHGGSEGPGTGGYGTGLVIGDEAILSDPVPALERAQRIQWPTGPGD